MHVKHMCAVSPYMLVPLEILSPPCKGPGAGSGSPSAASVSTSARGGAVARLARPEREHAALRVLRAAGGAGLRLGAGVGRAGAQGAAPWRSHAARGRGRRK